MDGRKVLISLRRAITAALAGVFSALAVIGGVAAYLSARHESSEFLDLQQRQIARYVGDLTFVASSEAALPPHDSEDDYVIEVTYSDGRPARTSGSSTIIPDRSSTGFFEFADSVGRWRVFSLVTPNRTVQVAQQVVVRHELATDAALRAVIPFVLAVPISWLVVTLVVGRVFRRLEDLAAEMSQRQLTDHSPIETSAVPIEALPFVLSINALLARLRRMMERQRDFLSDAAHELRTPLAALAIQIGNLGRSRSGNDFDARLKELEAGTRRVSALTGQLLRIARYDSLDPSPVEDSIQLDELAKEVVSALLPLADEREVDLGFAQLQSLTIRKSRTDLRTLVEILIDNAVRYTSSGGRADVSVALVAGRVVLEVVDTGPGVHESSLPRLTERFFRGTTSQVDGSGLGLAIAAAIARRHDIGLELSNRKDRPGFCAKLSFELS